ncbi:MAG: CAF17-like 4Fe-4S cluster assembly/insertion protein YgfZ [Planctomycetota bacterium]
MSGPVESTVGLRKDPMLAGPGARALVGISGEDHRDWIDRIASAPLKELARGSFRRATLMDGKGKLRADLRVIAEGPDDGLLLEIPASHSAHLLRVLDMYILRDRVTLHDMTVSHAVLSLLGPRAEATLADAGLPAAPACDAPGASEGTVARAGDTLALPSRLYGVRGTDLIAPATEIAAIERRLSAAGIERATDEELAAARIAAGIAWFAEDLSDGVIPLEAGLDPLVSVTKGCYPGQEVVARITNLGQVSRRLVRLAAPSGRPAPGETLHGTSSREGQEAGRLTSVAIAPTDGRVLALGFVRRPFWPEGTRVLAGDVELEVLGAACA